jgi:microcystin-dependent protein
MLEPFISVITLWAGVFCPREWAFCEGQTLSINQYPALYSLIGNFYGGDGRVTFQLPDLREKDGEGNPIPMSVNIQNGKLSHIICLNGVYPSRD